MGGVETWAIVMLTLALVGLISEVTATLQERRWRQSEADRTAAE